MTETSRPFYCFIIHLYVVPDGVKYIYWTELPMFVVLPSGDFFTLSQVTCVCMCVWTVSTIRDVKWPRTRVVGTPSQWSSKHLANVLADECLPHRPVLGIVWQLFAGFFVQCTIIGAFVKHCSLWGVALMVSPGFFCQTKGRLLDVWDRNGPTSGPAAC